MIGLGLEAVAWLLAVAGAGAALALRARLARRGELVARACHELRGPLTAARLALASLERPGDAVAARAVAIDQELRRAGLALEDLDAARAGRRARERDERVDLADVARRAAAAWEPVARAAGGEIRMCSGSGPEIVRGDRERLAQACGNLLANAIEHGGAHVEVEARGDSRRVRVEVRDSGPGLRSPIPALATRPRGLARPLEPARRGHGLAIAAEIAIRHGGRLAGAPVSRGACVALELPAAPPPRCSEPGAPRSPGSSRSVVRTPPVGP